MLPKWHILFGAVLSLGLYFFGVSLFNSIIVFIASVLIDVDHYLYYVFTKKDFSLKNAYKKGCKKYNKFYKLPAKKREKYKEDISIFHGIEFWILLFFLSFFYNLSFVISGIAFHIFLDFIDLYNKKEHFYMKLSSVYTYFKNKNKKNFIM